FSLEDRYLKRAGLDYWPLVDLRTYRDWEDFNRTHAALPAKFFSTHARKRYIDAPYARGDYLVFGGETRGLDRALLASNSERAYRIPIFEPGVRSLNLSNAVSVVVYEALRQLNMLSA
ncbi:MAG: tRNA (cytidine(34)-2'-O)-methyltransferase, partial [Candidatus Binataceae bacterium]